MSNPKQILNDYTLRITSGDSNLAIVVSPLRGGRITQLWAGGMQWLVPDESAALPGLFPAPFVRPGLGGWDDCAPNIAVCTLNGGQLVDHGDVWQLPWQIESTDPLVLGVKMVNVPASLHKRIVPTENGILVQYWLVNHSLDDVAMSWSAHPLFSSDGISISFKKSNSRILQWKKENGEEFPWDPVAPVAGVPRGSGEKFYLDTSLQISEVTLVKRTPSALPYSIRMSWNEKKLPYVGIWIDNRMCCSIPCLAIEPCLSWGDDPSNSSSVPTIGAEEIYSWWYKLEGFSIE